MNSDIFYYPGAVLASVFTGLKQSILSREDNPVRLDASEKIDLITSPSMYTIQYLKRGDNLSLKIGRKGTQSNVKHINFVIRRLA